MIVYWTFNAMFFCHVSSLKGLVVYRELSGFYQCLVPTGLLQSTALLRSGRERTRVRRNESSAMGYCSDQQYKNTLPLQFRW